MLKRISMLGISFSMTLILMSCSNGGTKTSDSSTSASSSKVTTESKSMESISSSSTTSESSSPSTMSETTSSEEDNKKISLEEYNKLSEKLKVYLASTAVDERALTPNLQGFYVFYNFDGNDLIVRVHSGVGRYHPFFILGYDNEFIYPKEELCYKSIEEFVNFDLDTTPVSKIDLLERYKENQSSFDTGVQNVQEMPDMTLENLEKMKSQNGNQ